jgi:hypothetical protein
MKPISHLVLTAVLGTACSMTLAAGSDDLWEMNISINTGGRSVPLQTMQNCMLKGQDHPTPPDKTCKVSNQGGLVGKGAMVMECAGPPPYSVKIEGTLTAKTMKGTMTVDSGGTTMVQEFTGKIVGSCDAATFVASAQGGMPAAGRTMPSFDPSSLPPKRSSNPAAAASAAQDAEASAQKDAKEPAKDGKSKALDTAKKALGGLFGL